MVLNFQVVILVDKSHEIVYYFSLCTNNLFQKFLFEVVSLSC